jgi:hypothetical protein
MLHKTPPFFDNADYFVAAFALELLFPRLSDLCGPPDSSMNVNN